jgi:hypothetical protein
LPVGGDVLGYARPDGAIVRYDVKANDYVVAFTTGISTLFKPDDGIDYYKRWKAKDISGKSVHRKSMPWKGVRKDDARGGGDMICPVCGKYEYSHGNEICQVCGWECGTLQDVEPDYGGAANKESLNEYKALYEKGETTWAKHYGKEGKPKEDW